MAKKSSIEKNNRRAAMAKRFNPRRERLKAIARDRNAAPEERFEAQLKLGGQEITGVFRERLSARPGEQIPILPRPDLIHLFDPQSGKPTRVGYKFLDDGRKVRFARRSGEVIDK